MTEIAIPTVTSATIETADVAAWLERAAGYEQLAKKLVPSMFVPQAYKPAISPNMSADARDDAYAVAVANATGAMMLGGAIGLDPLTSLQQIYFVHGRPGMYAKVKVALCLAAGHDVWDEDLTDDRAVVCGKRRGTDREIRIEITMDMAKRAGWTTNAAYAKTPRDMLWSRAAGRVCDRIASDLLMGISSIDDLQDVEVPSAPVPASRPVELGDILTSQVAAIGATVDDTAGSAAVVEVADLGEPAVTQRQLRDIGDLWQALRIAGPGSRARKAELTAQIVGRDVQSASALTSAEADTLIRGLTDRVVHVVEDPGTAVDQDTGELLDGPTPGWAPNDPS